MSNTGLYEMTGIVHKVGEEQTFASGFRKREVVLTNDIGDEARYPRYVPFAFKKDRADLAAQCHEGQRVKIVFALDGREYNGRYYAEVTGLKVDFLSVATTAPTVPADEPAPDAVEADDLPF